MRPLAVITTLAQGAVVTAVAVALFQAVDTAPGQPTVRATPTPCEIGPIFLPPRPEPPCQWVAANATGEAVQASATAYIMVAVTVTPCDPWAEEILTPTGSNPLVAPCGVVAHNATWTAVAATETAGILDGSYYGLHVSNRAPNWTPTIFTYGTVPAAELTAYPATLTAMPQETPYGWCLDGDRWVTTCGRQP